MRSVNSFRESLLLSEEIPEILVRLRRIPEHCHDSVSVSGRENKFLIFCFEVVSQFFFAVYFHSFISVSFYGFSSVADSSASIFPARAIVRDGGVFGNRTGDDENAPEVRGREDVGISLYSHCFMSFRIFASLRFFGLMLNSIFFTISVMTAAIMK